MNLVQIFNREDSELEKFKLINSKHLNAHLKSVFYYSVFFPIVEILSIVYWFDNMVWVSYNIRK